MATLKQTAAREKMTPHELLKQWGRDSFANNKELPSLLALRFTWKTIHTLSQLCEKDWEDLTESERSLVLDGFYEAKYAKMED